MSEYFWNIGMWHDFLHGIKVKSHKDWIKIKILKSKRAKDATNKDKYKIRLQNTCITTKCFDIKMKGEFEYILHLIEIDAGQHAVPVCTDLTIKTSS